MKLLKKLIPILTIASTTAVALPLTVSCSKRMLDDDLLKEWAFENLAFQYSTSVARQPEAERLITPVFQQFSDYLNNEDSGYKCYGASNLAGLAMEGIARQPEATSKIKSCMNLVLEKIKLSADYLAIGLGTVGGQAVEGIARQPEADGKIVRSVNLTIKHMDKIKDIDQACGIGTVGGQAAEGIARQPEAESYINKMLTITANSIEELNGNNQSSLNINKSNLTLVGTKGEPNKDIIFALSNGKGVDIGVIGAQAAEGIARQPEARNMIYENSLAWFDIIHSCKEIVKSRYIGQVGSYMVQAIARKPEINDVVKVLMKSIKQPFIQANVVRANFLGLIIDNYTDAFGRSYKDVGDEDIKATKLMGKIMQQIVDIGSDEKALKMSQLSSQFVAKVLFVEGIDYPKLEKSFLKEIDEIINE